MKASNCHDLAVSEFGQERVCMQLPPAASTAVPGVAAALLGAVAVIVGAVCHCAMLLTVLSSCYVLSAPNGGGGLVAGGCLQVYAGGCRCRCAGYVLGAQ